MFLKLLRAKLHRLTITGTDPDYAGSVTIDEDLLRASGILPNEVVLIADTNNGARFETYVIKGESGSGICAINGAAARLVSKGDRVIVFAHAFLTPQEAESHEAQVVLCDESNQIERELKYPSTLEESVPL